MTSAAASTLDRQPRLERDDSPHQRAEVDRPPARSGQPRQACVGGREPAQRVGARPDDRQAAAHVVAPVVGRALAAEQRLETAGNRLDRRQRVVQLVADDANQPLPRLTLLFAQRLTDRSDSTSSSCGEPPCQNLVRRISQRPTPPGSSRSWIVDGLPSDVLEAEVVGEAADEIAAFATEQPLAVAVDQHQPPCRCRRQRSRRRSPPSPRAAARSLPARRAVDCASVSASVLTSSITCPSASLAHGAARANREVVLAKRGQQIRDGLQRPDDPIAQRDRDAEPEAEQDRAERDADQPGILAEPEEDERRR